MRSPGYNLHFTWVGWSVFCLVLNILQSHFCFSTFCTTLWPPSWWNSSLLRALPRLGEPAPVIRSLIGSESIRTRVLIPTGENILPMESSRNESMFNLHLYPWFKKQKPFECLTLAWKQRVIQPGAWPTGPLRSNQSPSLETNVFRGTFWVRGCWVWSRAGGSNKRGTSPFIHICWAPASDQVLALEARTTWGLVNTLRCSHLAHLPQRRKLGICNGCGILSRH